LEFLVLTLPNVVDEPVAVVSRASMYRRYEPDFKRRMVAQYDALPVKGDERGSMLRREGLRRNQIWEWRKNHGVTRPADPCRLPKKREPKRTAEQIELARRDAKILKLEAELKRTRLALEITGKAHELLELLAESSDIEKPSARSSWQP
jgi:transposase